MEVGGQALSLALGLGTVLSIALILFRHPLLEFMGLTGAVTDISSNYRFATDFLVIRALASPAVYRCQLEFARISRYENAHLCFVPRKRCWFCSRRCFDRCLRSWTERCGHGNNHSGMDHRGAVSFCAVWEYTICRIDCRTFRWWKQQQFALKTIDHKNEYQTNIVNPAMGRY